MSDGRDVHAAELFEAVTGTAAGGRYCLYYDRLESMDILRIETDAHWYEFELINPKLGLTLVISDDPNIEDHIRCVIQGAEVVPVSRMIMIGRIAMDSGVALGCVRTDSADPEYMTGPVEKIFVNGDEVIFAKAKDPN